MKKHTTNQKKFESNFVLNQKIILNKNISKLSQFVTTLTLGSRPMQGFTRLRATRKPRSEGKCEGMNPHIPKGASTLKVWSHDGLPNLQKTIVRVKTKWIKEFFISL
jgi:hypothetical protein